MGRVLVVTGGKGGVGKTAAAANLGAALALRGKKVLLIDGDIGLRNLDIVMGLDGEIVYDLVDVVREDCDVNKALLRHGTVDGLYLLPASQTGDKSSVTKTQMKALLNRLRPDFDFIFIDCPAGIEQGFDAAVAGADEALIVTVPEIGCIRDADRVAALLEKHEITEIRLIINRLRPELIKKKLMPDIEDVMEYLSIDLLGAVPEDEKIVVAANSRELVAADPSSQAGKAYGNMAARLCGEKVELMNFKEKKGFFRRLFDFM